MKKQFVTYPIALALKELEFDEPCILGLSTLGVSRHKFTSPMTDDDYIRWDKYDTDLPIPLWQQVIDWLREEHFFIIINPYDDLNAFIEVDQILWDFTLWDKEWNNVSDYTYYHSYEEAREAAILKAIKLVKENKK